ncbi:MAG: 3-isopropylmalate dehydratase large subunit [Candidatus Diapherotrites archaeon]|nr:3-isopropylmalate dehydratase large subunit [Candidatus Diapherotrites archaeon]
MSENTLFDKIWNQHTVKELPTGQTQLFIGLHLVHEVTSPQAFQMLRENNWQVSFPERTFATADHIVPTNNQTRPFQDPLAETMMNELEKNVKEFGVKLFGIGNQNQGIVHVIGPELGLTQPGMTIACGDSHTSTHGAFGSLGFGIGTSQVRDVLATQCLAMNKLKVRKIEVKEKLSLGVYAKDLILNIIHELGINGGKGFAYEYCGNAIEQMNMEERMTICNMSIEGGALIGYVNPDQTTFKYIQGRKFAPTGKKFDLAIQYWKSICSEKSAKYDDKIKMNGKDIEPMITWGINPGQSIKINQKLPIIVDLPEQQQESAKLAYTHMNLEEGQKMEGLKINVAFIGSCTNSRITDLREAAKFVNGKKIAKNVQGLVVPGSVAVKLQAEKEELDVIFKKAGFEWRNAGCSLCLGMNTDKLKGTELCASSSNRNFIGRQGSPKGKTVLMSPAMVAIAAIQGQIADVRKYAKEITQAIN